MTNFNESEIRKAVLLLKPDRELFEIRFISGKWNASGYFTDADTLISEMKTFRPKTGANSYILLNHIKEECYSRAQRNRLVEYASPTTGDNDVDGLEWMMVDVDPRRAAGTSSSNDQVDKALKTARRIFMFLRDRGWEDPICAMSGNGAHLLYRIALENTSERVKLVENCLKTINMLFADDEMDIDLKTFNPSRICKLYGTMAQKGSNTEDRPHRMSAILYAPKTQKPNSIVLLRALVDLLPKEEPPQKYNSYNPKEFDLQKWIDDHGIKYTSKESWNGGTKWILECCPFNDQHRGKDASIIQTSDGKICYNCFHASCSDKKWKDVRVLFEPDAYEKKQIHDYAPRPNYLTIPQDELQLDDAIGPVFYTTEQIRLMKAPPEEFIKTGITEIDKRMRGLKKGFVTCLSGLRAGGKSSIISQMTISCRAQGYKVALYSGELTSKNLLKWLVLQAAGKAHVYESQYEGYYLPYPETEEAVSKWLNDFVFIYNNDYGNNFEQLMQRLRACVAEHKIDMVILDNMMALDIESLDRDIFVRQSKFVGELETFAKASNIHIMFVAHPRKSQGFLRLDDVSGSNDIVNRVDNALIIHRVNEDFKNRVKETLHWKEDNPNFSASNVIEIVKDRDGGNQDVFVPLYFESETKRLKNTESEYIHYEWEKGFEGDSSDWIKKADEAQPDEIPF